MPMERINTYRARKQREVDREMAERETRVNLRQAVARDGFVLQGGDTDLLQREAAAQEGGAVAEGGGAGCSPRAGNGRWVAQLQALGGKAKDSLDRGRMKIKHRRGQSLGVVPLHPSQLSGSP